MHVTLLLGCFQISSKRLAETSIGIRNVFRENKNHCMNVNQCSAVVKINCDNRVSTLNVSLLLEREVNFITFIALNKLVVYNGGDMTSFNVIGLPSFALLIGMLIEWNEKCTFEWKSPKIKMAKMKILNKNVNNCINKILKQKMYLYH